LSLQAIQELYSHNPIVQRIHILLYATSSSVRNFIFCHLLLESLHSSKIIDLSLTVHLLITSEHTSTLSYTTPS